MSYEHLVLRRFAGPTPYNAVDRIKDRKDAARPVPPRPCAAITWQDMFRAVSCFRGRAYRAGDAGRRRWSAA